MPMCSLRYRGHLLAFMVYQLKDGGFWPVLVVEREFPTEPFVQAINLGDRSFHTAADADDYACQVGRQWVDLWIDTPLATGLGLTQGLASRLLGASSSPPHD